VKADKGYVKVKTSYPATRNLIGNLYDTKRPHELYKMEASYPYLAASPFHDRMEAPGYGVYYGYVHGYGGNGYGYGPSFNKGREVAYNNGDLIYPDRLYGNAVDGDHDRYFRYSGLAYKNYNNYGYGNGYSSVYGNGYTSGYGNGYSSNGGYGNGYSSKGGYGNGYSSGYGNGYSSKGGYGNGYSSGYGNGYSSSDHRAECHA